MTTATNIGTGVSTSSGSTGSATLSGGASAGDTVFAFVLLRIPSGGTLSVADSQGNTWTQDTADTSGESVWRSILTTALSAGDTVSFSISGGTHSGYQMGVDTSAGGWTPDGAIPAWTSVSPTTTVHQASVTPPTAGDLLYAVDVAFGSESSFTASGGFTKLAQVANSQRGLATGYAVAADTSTVTATFTWNASHTGSMIAIAYKPASSGVSGTAAQTLPHLTQAAAGTVVAPSFTATAAQTLGPLTQAAAGTTTPPAFTGSAADTLPPLSQAASGGTVPPSFTGDAAQTLPPLGQSAAGTVTTPGVAGSADQTLPALSQAAAGAVVNPGFTAQAAQTLPALGQSATGARTLPNFAATAAQTLPSLTQSAAGTTAGPAFTGSIAQTLPALRQKARQNPPPHARSATVGLPLTSRRAGPPQTKSGLGRPQTRDRVGAVTASSD